MAREKNEDVTGKRAQENTLGSVVLDPRVKDPARPWGFGEPVNRGPRHLVVTGRQGM